MMRCPESLSCSTYIERSVQAAHKGAHYKYWNCHSKFASADAVGLGSGSGAHSVTMVGVLAIGC